MIRNSDSIKFESRRDIEQVQMALQNALDNKLREDDKSILTNIINELSIMHMNW